MKAIGRTKRKRLIIPKSGNNSKHHNTLMASGYKGLTIVILVLILTGLGIHQLLQEQSSKTQEGLKTTASNDVNIPILAFAGTSITNSQITNIELTKVQSLLQQGQYLNTVAQKRQIEDYVFYTLFDHIELANQAKIHKGLNTDALMKLVTPISSISSSKAHQFYNEHPFLFARSVPRIHVREIMVGNELQAQQILLKLHSGSSFVQLAQQYSVDPEQYKKQGGDLGWVIQGQMPMEWDTIAFSLTQGQISPVFRVASLYCILQVTEGPIYDTTPYDLVSPSVPLVAAAYIQQQQFLAWLSNHITHESLRIFVSTYSQAIEDALIDLQTHPDQGFMSNV